MSLSDDQLQFIRHLENLLRDRKSADPESSYTARLYHKGLDKILQKVGEEAVEYIIDSKNNHDTQNKERAVSEGADLLYHFIVSLSAQGLSLADVIEELQQRHK